LKWWIGEHIRPSGWKKILMGKFLLDRDVGPSRLTFFKLAPAGGAETVAREALILQQQLLHIKVCGNLISGDRSLLVTQKVGDGSEPPISLAAFIEKPADQVQPSLPAIVKDMASQVAALGESSPYQTFLRDLLWKYHERERLRNEWQKYIVMQSNSKDLTQNFDSIACDSTTVLDSVAASTRQVYFERQTCLHGDLNITNIALDDSATGPRVYIFDAEGCQPGVNVRDLAMLEVTALLHQPADGEPSLVQHCMALYHDQADVPDDLDYTQGSSRARNTLKLLAEIRKEVLTRAEPSIYALMVFDCALIQLGGLAWRYGNKISHPPDAALLGTLTANWLRRIAPEFFGDADFQS
jgi:Ser/Thr protein kinase RdoA (MazF antagonist)